MPITSRPQVRKSDLSPNRLQLLTILQRLNFGRLEGLHVRGGEPVFDPLPTMIREIKFGGETGPRLEYGSSDFALKSQLLELFSMFDRYRDCVVERLEVKHGMPFRMHVAESSR